MGVKSHQGCVFKVSRGAILVNTFIIGTAHHYSEFTLEMLMYNIAFFDSKVNHHCGEVFRVYIINVVNDKGTYFHPFFIHSR